MKNCKHLYSAVLCLVVVFTGMLSALAWTTRMLTHNPGRSCYPRLAVSGSSVYAVWIDHTPGNDEIFFRRSTDAGLSWQAQRRLTNNAQESWYPDIAVFDSRVYVVWEDGPSTSREIRFRRSTDGGVSWKRESRLSPVGRYATEPAIAVSGANVYVAWQIQEGVRSNIFFRSSGDSGISWQPIQRLTDSAKDVSRPCIAAEGSNVYVAWGDYNDPSGTGEVCFRRSADQGLTWKSIQTLTDNDTNSTDPRIAVFDSRICLAWDEIGPYDQEISFRNSLDGGGTWQAEQKLTDEDGIAFGPAIARSRSTIYLAYGTDTLGNDEIFFTSSPDEGVTWSAPQRLTNSAGESQGPSVAVLGSRIFVAYEDDTTGNGEIYLKHGTEK